MRKFLVILDNSTECLNAMRFAAMRAEKTGARVEVLAVIPPEEFNHWIGVGEVMREEARDRINAHFEILGKWMRDKHKIDPELVIREGKIVTEILAQIKEDQVVASEKVTIPNYLVNHLYRTYTFLYKKHFNSQD